ncbi:MAG: DUF1571 domain-containing protein [Phycisphaerae bacterium]|nr:DUF1571 domain-containing protein [Phycisphaerae bacterium]
MKSFVGFLCVGLFLLAAGCQPPAPLEHSSILKLSNDMDNQVPADVLNLAKTDHVALLKKGVEKYDAMPVKDYTCLFVKQEKLGGRLGDEQNVAIKFLGDPFSVAMVWTKNPPLGDALIYVEGEYKNNKGVSQMLVRPKPAFQWLVGKSVLKLPDGPDAMRNSLRPVTKFGFRNGLVSLLEVYEPAIAAKECKMQYDGVTEVGGRKCVVLTRILPEGKDYPARITETCLDIELLLPLRIVGYDRDNSLLCNYEYHEVKLNPGLKPRDFTPQANNIAPPKK